MFLRWEIIDMRGEDEICSTTRMSAASTSEGDPPTSNFHMVKAYVETRRISLTPAGYFCNMFTKPGSS
jgi:hypothetical protein